MAACIGVVGIAVSIAANRTEVPSTELTAANLELVAERIAERIEGHIVERIAVRIQEPVAHKPEPVEHIRAADNKPEREPHKLHRGMDNNGDNNTDGDELGHQFQFPSLPGLGLKTTMKSKPS
jgi:hypothetical protein